METAHGTARSGDIEISYWKVGSGIPLVVSGGPHLGHTYMRSLDGWAPDGYELIHYDGRGSGQTELGDPDRVTFTGAIEDLDNLRTHLGMDRMNLVGHSLGADLAVMYAAKRPEHTASLVVLNPGPPFIPELMQAFQMEMGSRRSPEDEQERVAMESSPGFSSGDPETLERYMLNTFTPFFSDRGQRDRCRLGFTEITAANAGLIGERLFRDLGQLDPIGSLADISCPALVVYSENDPIPEEFSRLLADKIASAEYQYLEGASHFVLFEDPSVLAAAVKPFLRSFAQ